MTFVLTLSISTATPLYNIGFFSVEIQLTCNDYFITDQSYIDWNIFYYVNILHKWFVSFLQSYITLTQTSIFISYIASTLCAKIDFKRKLTLCISQKGEYEHT